MLCVLAIAPPVTRGDTLHLNNGGVVRGWMLDGDGLASPAVVIKTPFGGVLVLPRQAIENVDRTSVNKEAYQRIAPQYGDNIKEQWRLAEWCRERRLKKQRAVHLRRIVELDTNHQGARRALGYAHVGGHWVRTADFLKDQGMSLYRGRYRISQEIELLEGRRRVELAEREWFEKLRRLLRNAMGENGGVALEQVAAIRDPLAIRAIGAALGKPFPRAVRLALSSSLANIAGRKAFDLLILLAVDDPDIEIRYASIQHLKKTKRPSIMASLVKSLKDASNARINRAAYALGELGDAAAVSPLIDALTTSHQRVFKSGQAGAVTTSFSADGSAFSTGGNKTRVVRRRYNNQEVLNSLIKLTGTNFGFNQTAWTAWRFAKNASSESVQGRRD